MGSRELAIAYFNDKSYRGRFKNKGWTWPDSKGMSYLHQPGDEVQRRYRWTRALSKPDTHKYWLITTYHRHGGSGYILLRDDGKLLSTEEIVNVDQQKRAEVWKTWNDGTAVKLMLTITEGRRYDLLPILADALEEACHPDPYLCKRLRKARGKEELVKISCRLLVEIGKRP